MDHILVYSDSLSWGIIPSTRRRQPFEGRWPGVMELALTRPGRPVRVIEDCLNGRRTVWEDPFKPGRNGLVGLAQRIEIHSPLALVILMLGTNDFQSMHPLTAQHAAQGIATLVGAIRQAPIEPGMPVPPILIVAPEDDWRLVAPGVSDTFIVLLRSDPTDLDGSGRMLLLRRRPAPSIHAGLTPARLVSS